MRKAKLMAVIALIIALVVVFAAACSGGGNSGGNSGGSGGGATTNGPSAPAQPTEPSGSSDPEFVMKISAGSAGADPQSEYMHMYADKLMELSGGRIEVQVWDANRLGNTMQSIQGVQDGTIESMASPTTFITTLAPELNIIDIPKLWAVGGDAARVLNDNPEAIKPMTDTLEAKGVKVISFVRNADKLILSNKDLSNLNTMADMKKLALKTWTQPGEILQTMVTAYGGSVAFLDLGEVTPSLQNGTIDATMTPMGIFEALGMYEVAPYMIDQPADPGVSMHTINIKFLESMPADLQELVFQAARDVYEDSNAYSAAYEQQTLDSMTSKGLNYIKTSDAFNAEFTAEMIKVGEDFIAKYPDMKGVYDALLALNK